MFEDQVVLDNEIIEVAELSMLEVEVEVLEVPESLESALLLKLETEVVVKVAV